MRKHLVLNKSLYTAENDYGELISGETTIAFADIKLAKQNLKTYFEKKFKL